MASPSTGPVEPRQPDNVTEVATPPGRTERSPEQIKRDEKSFDDYQKQAWSDRQAGSDDFDRALLTLSSGTLALSMAFIKDVVPLAQATHLPLLFASWICFAVCIVVTLISFRFSIIAQDKHLKFASLYYIDGDIKAGTEQHWSTKALEWCAYVGGSLLIIGFALTISFAIINIKARRMTDNDKTKTEIKSQMAHDGRSPVTITPSRVPEIRGRQPVPIVKSDTLEKGRSPVPIVTNPPKTGTQTGESSTSSNSGQQTSGGKQ